MDSYKIQSKKGEGCFAEVYKAQSIKTGNHVALKCMKKKFKSLQQVRKLKQIQAFKLLSPHQNIIKFIEVLYDESSGKVTLVFELMQQNFYQCLSSKSSQINPKKIKGYMHQLLKAIAHLHKQGIFHRNIKPENVLISGDNVKLADFGFCNGIYRQHPYTQYISTRWYRAPECLMTDGYYDEKMDIWGFGCILFQMMTKYPLFPGKNELDQIHRIHKILGTPKQQLLDKFKNHATHMEFNFTHEQGIGLEKLLPHNTDQQTIDFLYMLLALDPAERPTAEQALKNEYFKDVEDKSENVRFMPIKPKL